MKVNSFTACVGNLNLKRFNDLFETSTQSLTKGGDVETVMPPTLNITLTFFIMLLLHLSGAE